jgi:hypothetical protein
MQDCNFFSDLAVISVVGVPGIGQLKSHPNDNIIERKKETEEKAKCTMGMV